MNKRWKNKTLVKKGSSGWTYAKTLKQMPRQSGRYLLMNGLGTFFFGYWDSHERSLYTQCVGCVELGTGLRRTNGVVQMAKWDWRANGRVFWKDVGEPTFYEVYRRGGGPTHA